MTTMAMQTATETDRDYISRAQAKGQALYRNGVVEVLGGTVALVEDDGMVYVADATGCGCSTAEERNGHACSHQWAGRHALAAMEMQAQESAA